MGWGKKRLFLVLMMWMEKLIFLLWYVKKKKKERQTFQERRTSENISTELQHRWSESPGLRGSHMTRWVLEHLRWKSEDVSHFIAVFMGVPNVRTA